MADWDAQMSSCVRQLAMGLPNAGRLVKLQVDGVEMRREMKVVPVWFGGKASVQVGSNTNDPMFNGPSALT